MRAREGGRRRARLSGVLVDRARPGNKLMAGLVSEFNLTAVRPLHEGLAGVHDGERFTFVESSWKAVTIARLLRRYGALFTATLPACRKPGAR